MAGKAGKTGQILKILIRKFRIALCASFLNSEGLYRIFTKLSQYDRIHLRTF